MFKTIALGTVLVLVAGIAIVCLIAATRPATFEIRRTQTMQATHDKVFPLVNDMRRFNTWNPYAHKDPAMHSQFAGPPEGPGARLDFAGNKDVGRGTLEITESQAPTRVAMELHMLEPFEARNQAEFSLMPTGTGGTQVTWAMRGASPFISRVIGIFVDIDKMVGRDFEVGLDNLKAAVEKPAQGTKA